jgi:uncharacterized protein YceK
MLKISLMITVAFALSGCQTLAEIAYDAQTENAARRCEAQISQADRQACKARVREVENQAAEARKTR